MYTYAYTYTHAQPQKRNAEHGCDIFFHEHYQMVAQMTPCACCWWLKWLSVCFQLAMFAFQRLHAQDPSLIVKRSRPSFCISSPWAWPSPQCLWLQRGLKLMTKRCRRTNDYVLQWERGLCMPRGCRCHTSAIDCTHSDTHPEKMIF